MCVPACGAGDVVAYECACLTAAQVEEANSASGGMLAFCIAFIVIGGAALYFNAVVAVFCTDDDDASSCFPMGHTMRWLAGTVLFCVGSAFLASMLSVPTNRYIDSGCESTGAPSPDDAGTNVSGLLLGVFAPVGGLTACIGGSWLQQYCANAKRERDEAVRDHTMTSSSAASSGVEMT